MCNKYIGIQKKRKTKCCIEKARGELMFGDLKNDTNLLVNSYVHGSNTILLQKDLILLSIIALKPLMNLKTDLNILVFLRGIEYRTAVHCDSFTVLFYFIYGCLTNLYTKLKSLRCNLVVARPSPSSFFLRFQTRGIL